VLTFSLYGLGNRNWWGKQMGYDLEKIAAALDALPAKRSAADEKREAIKALVPQIKSMVERGYSWAEVAEALKKEGLEASATTLRTLAGDKKRGRKRAAKPAGGAT
jgi:DNA-binding transcriptional MerR regulator